MFTHMNIYTESNFSLQSFTLGLELKEERKPLGLCKEKITEIECKASVSGLVNERTLKMLNYQ